MAGRQSFLLYTEDLTDLSKLSDKEAGQLLKAIVAYQETGLMPDKLPVRADCMFGFIRRSLDKNREKYEKTCKARSEAGKKGGRPKTTGESCPEPSPDTADDHADCDDSEKQMKAKKANGFFALPEKAKKANGFFALPEKAKKAEHEHEHEHDHEHEHEHDHEHEHEHEHEEAEENREQRIRYLETMLRLFENGTFSDREDYLEYKAELERLHND